MRNSNRVLPMIGASELMEAPIEERAYLLEPLLTRTSLALVQAPRGLGKTFFTLSLAWAVAAGEGFLGWRGTGQKRRVLYIDGEMPMAEMRERVRGLGSMPPTLKFLMADAVSEGLPDLGHQNGLVRLITNWGTPAPELVVFDSIATLTGRRTGNSDRWSALQQFGLHCRQREIAILFVHHTNKRGLQRGTAAKEDMLDLVLALRRPADYEPSQGARFEIHFDKARGLYGADADPIEARLQADPIHGTARWDWRPVTDSEMERLRTLLAQGLSANQAAREMGISKSKAYRMKASF